MIDHLIRPHPAPNLSGGRGVEAMVLAIRDGHHVLDNVGKRREERGMIARLPPGYTRAALHDYRVGPIREALLAAHLNTVLRTVALQARAVYDLPTPGLPQDTTTIARSGADQDEPQTLGAPRPADGHRTDGRDDRKPVRLRLGVSGAGGIPRRLGGRDGKRRESVETPQAIAECLAVGLAGRRGSVAARQAYRRRT